MPAVLRAVRKSAKAEVDVAEVEWRRPDCDHAVADDNCPHYE
jgi:hypothetical protein